MTNPSETGVLQSIISWASHLQNVKVVILTGSRANPGARVDEHSDYDIELAVENAEDFFHDDSWINDFYKVAAFVKDTDQLTKLVLYMNNIRIDFTIYSVNELKRKISSVKLPVNWDTGYKVLLDKDGSTENIKPASNKVFCINKPSEDEFIKTVNDFWWDVTYVAKALKRGELFFAKYMLDSVIRFNYVERLLSWYVSMNNNWNVSSGKHGRSFEILLDNKTLEQLKQTFAGSGIEENKKALETMTELSSNIARKIAEHLNYNYPTETEDNIKNYCKSL